MAKKKEIRIKTTTCKKCGKVVEYTTKKPGYCKEHSPASVYRKPKRAPIPQRSKLEFRIQMFVRELFPDRPVIFGGYYSWLPSPKGYPMQLDVFVYGNKPHFAIEVEGQQHDTKQYFQTEEEFQYLQKCDKLKEEILRTKGIKLFKVPHTVITLDQFKQIVKEVL
jgi:hypothetical protein